MMGLRCAVNLTIFTFSRMDGTMIHMDNHLDSRPDLNAIKTRGKISKVGVIQDQRQNR